MPLRAGIVGCGMIAGAPLRGDTPIAGSHAAACRKVPGVELVAAADPDATRRAKFAAHWGVPRVFDCIESMLSAVDLDIVIVATPPETHEHVCLSAVSSGVRGILCEKPFTGSAEGARRLTEAARRRRCALVVNFSRRWDRSHRELARQLGADGLGSIRQIFASYTGTLRGNGSHFVDTLHMLAPGEWRVVWTSPLPLGTGDGSIDVLLERSDGARAHLAAIRDSDYFVFESEVLATRGRVRLLFGGNDIRIEYPGSRPEYPGYRYLSNATELPKMTLVEASANALDALVTAIRTGADVDVPAESHIASLALVDSIVQYSTSAERQR